MRSDEYGDWWEEDDLAPWPNAYGVVSVWTEHHDDDDFGWPLQAWFIPVRSSGESLRMPRNWSLV